MSMFSFKLFFIAFSAYMDHSMSIEPDKVHHWQLALNLQEQQHGSVTFKKLFFSY